jgi:FSR family fosmidomycin resistance protein-like MFS transporter
MVQKTSSNTGKAIPPSGAASDKRGEPMRGWALVGLAWLHFVNDGGANFLPGVLPVVLVAIGKPASLAATLMFVLVAGQALQPVTGLLGRRLGGRKLMWIGVIGVPIGAGLVGLAPNLTWLVVVLALMGAANACFHPQALAAARAFAGRRGHFGLALMMLGGEIGRGVWPLIASAAVALGSLRSLWVPAAIALATVPVVYWLLPPRQTQATEWRIRLKGRLGATGSLLAYTGVRGLVITGATVYLPILWKARGGGLIGGAALITLMLIAGLGGTLYGANLADRIGRRPVLAVAGAGMIAGVALIAWGAVPAMWAGATVLGLAAFATFPLTTALGQDLFPENRPFGSGLALGLGNALGAGLAALVGLSLGVLALSGLFWILVAAAVLDLALVAVLPLAQPNEAGV